VTRSARVVRFVVVASFLALPARRAVAEESAPVLEVVKLKPSATAEKLTPIDQEVDQVLSRISDKETDEISDKTDFDRLIELEKAAVPRLSAVLKDANAKYDHRWVSARALGKIGGKDSIAQLRSTLANDKFSMMRLAAIHGLKDSNDAGSFDVLVKALGDDAMVVRSGAADALGSFGDARAVKPLVDALNREDNFYKGRSLWVRRHIVDALGKIESRSAVATLIMTIDDADRTVGIAAVASLERVTKVSFRVPATNQTEWLARTSPKWKTWWEENKKDYL
jgi:HEAT repeat protein